MKLPGLSARPADGRGDEWGPVPIYRAIKWTCEPWVRRGFRIHTLDIEHVPVGGGAILASNHASYFDPVFLGAVVPRPIHWMAKAGLFRHPVTNFVFTRSGPVKVDRSAGGNHAAVDACADLVVRGRLIGIFPEGHRTLDGSLRQGRTGVARVALRSGAPVIPVAITSFEVLPKHTYVPNLDGPLVVAFGPPLSFPAMADLAEDRPTCRKITDEVMGEIARLLEVARTRRGAVALASGGPSS